MVKSRRTRKNQPQLITSSNNASQALSLDSDRPRKAAEVKSKKHRTGKHATPSSSGSTAPLSKRQRKQLERYLEKTKKRSNRGEVYAQLQELQKSIATPARLKSHGVSSRPGTAGKPSNAAGQPAEDSSTTSLLSISQAQTKGLKRQRLEKQARKTAKVKKPKLFSDDDDAQDVPEPEIKLSESVRTNLPENKSEAADFVVFSVADKLSESDAVSVGEVIQPMAVDKNDEDDRNPNADFDFVRKRREKPNTDHRDQPKSNPFRRETFCPVHRTDTIQAARMQLPIIGYEQQIMEMIAQNDIVVICGETGSGKTTQVPQFLYESGYASGSGMIGITEPRRVAAISMSQRVADEMNVPKSRQVVAYHIRYETNVSSAETRIKFMTDGVLLRELSQDFLLMKYSVIVLDEAHERSSFTDILIGLLSRIVRLRDKRDAPLKLIIMSATLRVEDFTQNVRLFPTPPPVMHVQARQYDVQLYYNKRTPEKYLLAAYKKVCKIHGQLPSGSILVFVTGQQEVHTLCRWLRQTFREPPLAKNDEYRTERPATAGEESAVATVDGAEAENSAEEAENIADETAADGVTLDNYSVEPIDEDDERFVSLKQISRMQPAKSDGKPQRNSRVINDAALNAIDDAEEGDDGEGDSAHPHDDGDDETDLFGRGFDSSSSEPLRILPLYSLLSTERQQQVFEPSPPGVRTCIVATNVAETSLTLPGVRYVVDCGKVKAKLYDPVTGASTFNVMWTSKASAEQRAGRAGRIASGHCYRLYSSAVFNDEFEQCTPCEIVRRPIPDLVLQMKAMHIIKVDNFPFPTPPNSDAVRAAERELIQLGALSTTLGEGGQNDSEEAHKRGVDSVADVVAAARVDAVVAIARAQNVSQSVLRRRVAKAKQSVATAGSVGGDRTAGASISRITPLGQSMAQIPLMPRYSKALVLAVQKAPDLVPYLIAVVSALTVPEVLLDGANMPDADLEENSGSNSAAAFFKALQVLKKRWVSSSQQTLLFGDLGVLLKAIGGAEYAGCARDWCEAHGLRYKAVLEIRHLRHQLTSIVARVFADILHARRESKKVLDLSELKLAPPTDGQLERMRQIMLKSMPFNVARRADDADLASYEQQSRQQQTTSTSAAAGKVASELTKHDLQRAYKCIKTDEFVFIHPTSVLSSSGKNLVAQLPQHILFQDLFESKGKRRRLYCRHVAAIEPDWLPMLAPDFCHFEEMVKIDPVTSAMVDLDVNADTLHEVFDNGNVFYDTTKGKVMCQKRCTWGPLLWPMSRPALVPYAENVERTKLFAAYFVRGDVFVAMKKNAASLKWPPNVMLKSWSKLLPHTQALMRVLVKNGVDSKARIESVWRGGKRAGEAEGSDSSRNAQPLFLLEEYLMWLPEHLHGSVRQAWPPLK